MSTSCFSSFVAAVFGQAVNTRTTLLWYRLQTKLVALGRKGGDSKATKSIQSNQKINNAY